MVALTEDSIARLRAMFAREDWADATAALETGCGTNLPLMNAASVPALDRVTSDVVGPECYVAFFGAEFPSCEPTDRPYLLRYAASSLQKLD